MGPQEEAAPLCQAPGLALWGQRHPCDWGTTGKRIADSCRLHAGIGARTQGFSEQQTKGQKLQGLSGESVTEVPPWGPLGAAKDK